MNKIILMSFGFLLSASLMSCSQTTSNSSACNTAGYYGDQAECQNSVSLGTCTSTTVPTNDKNLVCWKSSTTSNQTGSTGTSTNTSTGCSGVAPPWTMGAWTPAACGPGVTTQTRTVTCNYTCACNPTVPSTTQTCTPDLFNNQHYSAECTAKGGSLDWVEGNHICSIPGSACPSGWSQLYYNSTPYTQTSANSAQDNTNCTGGRATVYTGSHSSFSPARAVESLTYCSWYKCITGCYSHQTIYANVVRVACY